MQYNFHLDILKDHVKIGEALAINCTIKFDEKAEVMRGIQFEMSEDRINITPIQNGNTPTFDRFTNRIRPVLEYNGVSYPLGVYMITTTPESLSDTGSYMQCEGYDETMILKQAKSTNRLYYDINTSYLSIIEGLLTECGLTNVIADASTAAISPAREYEPGKSYLEIINELLTEIDYEPVYADLNGYIHLHKKQNKQTADISYTDISDFKIIKPVKRTTDIYNLPNVITGVVTSPEKDVRIYTAENTRLDSAISIPKRGYRVVQVVKLGNIADTDTLKEYIDRLMLQAMQTTETIEFSTFAEGQHEYGTMISIDTNLVSGLYRETAYTIRIDRTARMSHTLERKVYV